MASGLPKIYWTPYWRSTLRHYVRLPLRDFAEILRRLADLERVDRLVKRVEAYLEAQLLSEEPRRRALGEAAMFNHASVYAFLLHAAEEYLEG